MHELPLKIILAGYSCIVFGGTTCVHVIELLRQRGMAFWSRKQEVFLRASRERAIPGTWKLHNSGAKVLMPFGVRARLTVDLYLDLQWAALTATGSAKIFEGKIPRQALFHVIAAGALPQHRGDRRTVEAAHFMATAISPNSLATLREVQAW